MAWIRRVRTASGATAVQIAESVAGRRRIVRHVGSARDEAELGLLIEQARQLLVDDRQGVLDLGITPAARKAVMVPQPAPAALFPGTAARPMPAPTVSAPRVLKTPRVCCSRRWPVCTPIWGSTSSVMRSSETW